MRRFSVISFCVFAVAITIYGFIQPSYHLQQLINPGLGYAAFRIAAALIVAVYELWPRIRTSFGKQLVRMWGLLLFGFGAITFVSPTFMGSFWNYVPLGDVFISIEAGVLALLLSIRLPAKQPPTIITSWNEVKNRLASEPRKLLPVVSQSKAKAAQA